MFKFLSQEELIEGRRRAWQQREVFHQHELWLEDINKGKRACLKNVDLSYGSMFAVDLRGADLEGANFEGTYLDNADLESANLFGANLKNTYLNWADLSFANLAGADLSGSVLPGIFNHAIGNGREILTVLTGSCHVNISDDYVWINYDSHSWDEWLKLSDTDIRSKKFNNDDADDTIEWWHEWKPKLATIIEERATQREMDIKKESPADNKMALTPMLSL